MKGMSCFCIKPEPVRQLQNVISLPDLNDGLVLGKLSLKLLAHHAGKRQFQQRQKQSSQKESAQLHSKYNFVIQQAFAFLPIGHENG